MSKIIVVAEVEDLVKWEAGFRTHGDLFRSQTITKPIHFGTIAGNQAAICLEPEDLAACMATLDSPATEEAMTSDGVKRETVKVFVLDKTLEV